MSSPSELGPFILGERVGTSVWLAEDTRSSRRVALKLLTRALPKEPARREAMLRDVRIRAALYHTFLVPILEIVAVDDSLVMLMDVVEAQPISQRFRGKPADRETFFRIAHQLASVVKYLHMKELLHGNITGDSVMVTAEGQIRLGGLNLINLLRRDKSSMVWQHKGSDIRSVAYMAPEQIAQQFIDERTDVFATGVVLYVIATGSLPFKGEGAAEMARAIVEGQPASPKTLNPQIDNAVLATLGRCLFKDAGKRLRDAKTLLDTIDHADPEATHFAAKFEKKASAAPAAPSSDTRTRRSLLFLAEIAGYDELASADPEAARQAAARMQQVLGEAVYLFDGQVVDPFGTRLVAELPSVDSALEAARKAEFDAREAEPPLHVRMMLHAGEIEVRDGAATGPAVDSGFGATSQLAPNSLHISEEFVREGRGNVRLRDAGARGGLKLFTIVEPEPAATKEPTSPTEEERAAEAAAAEEEAAVAAVVSNRKRSMAVAIAGVVVLLLAIGALVMWLRLDRENAQPVIAAADAPAAPSSPTAENPQRVQLAAFRIDSSAPAAAERAEVVRQTAMAVIRAWPELRLVDKPAPDALIISAQVRERAVLAEAPTVANATADDTAQGTAAPTDTAAPEPPVTEFVPMSGSRLGNAVEMTNLAVPVRTLLEWTLREAKAKPHRIASDETLEALAEAVAARTANDAERAQTAIRKAVTLDPQFLPSQQAAMEIFAEAGLNEESVEAARQIVALDPANLDATRRVARASLISGDIRQAFELFSLVLKREPRDAESLNLFARYALSAGDTARFNATLEQLKAVTPREVAAHEPDALAAAGRLDAAIQRYYTVEETNPDNPALALKVGRLAVLRHSLPIAEIELAKLQKSDPLFGYHMLSAYIEAEKGNRAASLRELETALASAVPGDDAWTSAAEVYAILSDTNSVLASLEKAAARKEPTAAYVLAHPLFRYLENEPRFQKVATLLGEQQSEVRAALAAVK